MLRCVCTAIQRRADRARWPGATIDRDLRRCRRRVRQPAPSGQVDRSEAAAAASGTSAKPRTRVGGLHRRTQPTIAQKGTRMIVFGGSRNGVDWCAQRRKQPGKSRIVNFVCALRCGGGRSVPAGPVHTTTLRRQPSRSIGTHWSAQLHYPQQRLVVGHRIAIINSDPGTITGLRIAQRRGRARTRVELEAVAE